MMPTLTVQAAANIHTDSAGVKYMLETDGVQYTAVVNGPNDYDGETLTIPKTVTGDDNITYKVTEIAYEAFSLNANIKNLIIEGAPSVGEAAFQCDGYSANGKLISVDLGSITSISNYMLSGQVDLSSVVIPSTVTEIGYGAFACNSNLSKVTILGENVDFIKDPNQVKDVYYGIFESCSDDLIITVKTGDMKTKVEAILENDGIDTAKVVVDKSDSSTDTGDSNDNDNAPSENNKPSDNNTSSKNNNPAPVIPKWIPTADDLFRMAFKGSVAPSYTTSNVNYNFRLENEMQGPKCIAVFDLFRGDYSIGQTYSAYMNDELVYELDGATTITLAIPEKLVKENRAYEMICVHENGQGIVLKDEDLEPSTITFTTDKCHAFALCYLDQ